MSKRKIKVSLSVKERCLLTEVMPFETPLFFSNWGSFNYIHSLKDDLAAPPPALVKELYLDKSSRNRVPYEFRVKKDLDGFRTLHLVHPSCSESITHFFRDFENQITKLCEKSRFSIRVPIDITKYFLVAGSSSDDTKYIEELDESKPYTSSYFKYRGYAHLYRYFESRSYLGSERRFKELYHLDIAKFFPSIYTHSIDWAISGKREAKKLVSTDKTSIGPRFDNLMQRMNDRETNGIVVGPELSRIFSEVIMQDIDRKIEIRMEELGLIFGRQYECSRYIDDIFLFVREKKTADSFVDIARNELEQFKLHLNDAKTQIHERPFVTTISSSKVRISKFIDATFRSLMDETQTFKDNHLFELREIVKQCGSHWNAITNFTMSAIIKNTNQLRHIKDPRHFEKAAEATIQLFFSCLAFDTRIGGCYKTYKFIMTIMSVAVSKAKRSRSLIQLSLHHEVLSAVRSAIENGCILESLSLLNSLDCIDYKSPTAQRQELVRILEFLDPTSKAKKAHERLSYFEIVSILYYCRGKPNLSDIVTEVSEKALTLISANNPIEHAESLYLFMDVISCPDVPRTIKDRIVGAVIAAVGGAGHNKNTIVDYISMHTWYSNWNGGSGITKQLLKKKDLTLTY